MEEESRELSEYSLIELQDKIEELYEQYKNLKIGLREKILESYLLN